MRLLLQRVIRASVAVSGKTVGEIEHGWLVLTGVGRTDQASTAKFMAEKILGLRLFSDSEGKFNQSIADVRGGLLVVSQFTLYADCRKGRRPSFSESGPPEMARPIYEAFISHLKESGLRVANGLFGADMQVELVNDGPVTIYLDSNDFGGAS